jgi:hypothetical protein
MTELHFPKLSRFDRLAEPATVILFAGAATPEGLLDWYEYPV